MSSVRRVLFGALLVSLPACLTPPPESQQAIDAARELNVAARFGRMDVAVGRTAAPARATFLQRHAQWGKNVRVLDVELSGMQMKDTHHAVIDVDVSWERMDDSMLHQTRLAQNWSDREKGGWQLTRERRVAGDIGLFGENVEVLRPQPENAHFPVTTIR
jgi:hypothetical protein